MSYFGLTFLGAPNVYKYNRGFYETVEFKDPSIEEHITERFAKKQAHERQLLFDVRAPQPSSHHLDTTIGKRKLDNPFYGNNTLQGQELTQLDASSSLDSRAIEMHSENTTSAMSERQLRRQKRIAASSPDAPHPVQQTPKFKSVANKYRHQGEMYLENKDNIPNLSCRENKSHEQWKENIEVRHARLKHDPQQRYLGPVTSTMEVGWKAKEEVQQQHKRSLEQTLGTLNDDLPDVVRRTKNSCAETRYAHAMLQLGI